MRHDPTVQRVVSSYQLGLPRMPTAGRSGELLGRGTGSSLEFQEYREYLPGDDIRHIDWAAYARSDSLMVRLYREEISPRTEILLDLSASMTTGGGAKALLARQLAAMFALLAGQLGGRPGVTLLGDHVPPEKLTLETLDRLQTQEFASRTPFAELVMQGNVALSRQAVRIVISDFMFPHDPGPLIRRLATEASALWVLQVLNEWEAHPTALGGRRLIDSESEQESDLIINQATIDEYLQRLTRLQQELARECRRVHAPFMTLIAERGLPLVCRDELCQSGILRPV